MGLNFEKTDSTVIIHGGNTTIEMTVMLSRDLHQMLFPEEIIDINGLVMRVGFRALWEGFTLVNFSSSEIIGVTFQGNERLMMMYSFFHPDGRVLTVEEWKSYRLASSYRFSKSALYENPEQHSLIMSQYRMRVLSEKSDTAQFLVDRMKS